MVFSRDSLTERHTEENFCTLVDRQDRQARRRPGIDQIRTKKHFVLTERKMYPLSRTQGGSTHFWYWVPILNFWFPLQRVPGTNIRYIEGMAVCHRREAKRCFRKG